MFAFSDLPIELIRQDIVSSLDGKDIVKVALFDKWCMNDVVCLSPPFQKQIQLARDEHVKVEVVREVTDSIYQTLMREFSFNANLGQGMDIETFHHHMKLAYVKTGNVQRLRETITYSFIIPGRLEDLADACIENDNVLCMQVCLDTVETACENVDDGINDVEEEESVTYCLNMILNEQQSTSPLCARAVVEYMRARNIVVPEEELRRLGL